MRFNEELNEERGQEEPVKKSKTKEKPRSLAGSDTYDYSDLGGNKPFMGSNPWS